MRRHGHGNEFVRDQTTCWHPSADFMPGETSFPSKFLSPAPRLQGHVETSSWEHAPGLWIPVDLRTAGRGDSITHPALEIDRVGGLCTSLIFWKSLALSGVGVGVKTCEKIMKCFHYSSRCNSHPSGEDKEIYTGCWAVSPAGAHVGTSPIGAREGCLRDEEPSAGGLFRRKYLGWAASLSPGNWYWKQVENAAFLSLPQNAPLCPSSDLKACCGAGALREGCTHCSNVTCPSVFH